jgi:hypothetical protein
MMTTTPAANFSLQDMPLPAAPFLASVMQIEPQWIDYNGHLNMAYYNVMFDRAIDELWLKLGIGPGYMQERHGSTFSAECHVRYLREIHLGDPVQIAVLLVDADEKRLHTFEELRHAGVGDFGKHDNPYRYDRAQDRAVSTRHPRPDRDAGERSRGDSAAGGHRPQDRDAFEIAASRARERKCCRRVMRRQHQDRPQTQRARHRTRAHAVKLRTLLNGLERRKCTTGPSCDRMSPNHQVVSRAKPAQTMFFPKRVSRSKTRCLYQNAL